MVNGGLTPVRPTIQNYVASGLDADGLPTMGDMAEDVTTDDQYDSAGRLVTETAYDATGSALVPEATKYLYTSPFDGSLQTVEVDPDSTDTLTQDPTTLDWTISSGSDHTTTTYDLAGETLTSTDERGVTHAYAYNGAGQEISDTVTSFGPTGQVDETVNQIDTSYNPLGQVDQVTSLGNSGIVNQVQYAYDGWGDETCEWQALTGQVYTASTPSVQYEYDDGGVGGVAAYVRLTDQIYPNGRDVSYGYGTQGGIDDIMSRVESITDATSTLALADYTYLGTDTIASENYEQPQVELDYSANDFAALDRFGNILDQVWSSDGGNSGNAGTLDGYGYTYDQSGNRSSETNLTDGALSESYQYDKLDRLTGADRSDGNDTQTWTLDSLGNFTQSTDNSTTQARTTDAANELQTVTTGGTTASPTYDAAGNMTSDGTEIYVYDAWDRLVKSYAESSVPTQNTLSGTFAQAAVPGTLTGTISGQVEYTDTNFVWTSLNWSDDSTAVTMVVTPMTGCAPTHLTMGYETSAGNWTIDDFALNSSNTQANGDGSYTISVNLSNCPDTSSSPSTSLSFAGNLENVAVHDEGNGGLYDSAGYRIGTTNYSTWTLAPDASSPNVWPGGNNFYVTYSFTGTVSFNLPSQQLGSYAYDGLNREIVEYTNFTGSTPPTVTYSYFSGQNAIETRVGSPASSPQSLAPYYQYVFSPLGGKTPILRDSTFDANGNPTNAGRLYYLSDANTNVTAVAGYNTETSTWAVAERYFYDPYGNATVYDKTWTEVGTSLADSTVGNTIGFASMVFDPATGLYKDEARWYSTEVSTFISRDPAMADLNTYRYCGNEPTDGTDPSGMNVNVNGSYNVNGETVYPTTGSNWVTSWEASPAATVQFANDVREKLLEKVQTLVQGSSPAVSPDNYKFEVSIGVPGGDCSKFNNPPQRGGGRIVQDKGAPWVVSSVASAGGWSCNTIHGARFSTGPVNQSGYIQLYVKGLCPGKYRVTVIWAMELRSVAQSTAVGQISTPLRLAVNEVSAAPKHTAYSSGRQALLIPVTITRQDEEKLILVYHGDPVCSRVATTSAYSITVAGFRISGIRNVS